jgi:S-DNA-T family DNA segregation ATPase FtsK/SpoIIIE
VVATIAPVIASVAMWLITGSLFALMFAALGPLTAIAGLLDARIGAGRARRRGRERFDRDADRARALILRAHELEGAAIADAHPVASSLVLRSGADPYRWRADSGGSTVVVVGPGSVRSAVRLDRRSSADGHDPSIDETLAELDASARDREGHVLIDARLGIGIVGVPPLTAAVARAIAVQLAWALSPRTHWVEAEPGESAWTGLLPHPGPPTTPAGPSGAFRFGRVGSTDADIVVATAEREAQLPSACGVVIATSAGSGSAIVQHPDRTERRPIALELLSREEAAAWAASVRVDAEREGLVTGAHGLPGAVALRELYDLTALDAEPPPPGLAARFCSSARGPVEIDLVRHGPHAVIGGTTGSGKSELLVTWVLSLAARYPPERVTFLLVDFKGGAAFGPLAALPHTVGIVTDLDPERALRALTSLKAELAFRERALAEAQVSDIGRVADLARLVIVVDEFATMVSDHPDLHALFSDIAARGRSLGVHLVLCTQRPGGVIRDSVLANADLRISLRVNNRSDSEAVVGCHDAAALPVKPRGRAVIRVAGGDPVHAQIALADGDDARLIATAHPVLAPIRRPWCEPLPGRVSIDAVPVAAAPGGGGEPQLGGAPAADDLVFGLADLPHQQRIGLAIWNPPTMGNAIVLGATGSGKTTALETIGSRAGRVVWVPRSPDAAWDTVCALEAELPDSTLVIVDDVDSLLARLPFEYRGAFVERLVRVLRDGHERGTHAVLAAERLTADAVPLASLVPDRLLLRHSTRQDWVAAGGESSTFTASLPPGGARWRGSRIQVACGAPGRPAETPAVLSNVAGSRPLAIVSSRARALADRLAPHGRVIELAGISGDLRAALLESGDPVAGAGARPILLGDADDWQSRWGALGALRDHADVLFESCALSDYRALSRSRDLPPLIVSQPALTAAVCWQLTRDGTATRVRLPLG